MAPSFQTFLSAQATASSLSLAYADVGDEGALEIAKFLSESAHLRHLDLTGNNISAIGAAHLAGALRLNRTLESLTLKFNRVGTDGEAGLASLCRALRTNTYLQHLDLRHNSISGGLACQCIGEMLKENKVLTHLELSWNPLEPAGGQTLLDHIGMNTTLIDCQLSGCKIADETLLSIARNLYRNRKAKNADMQAGPYAASREIDVGGVSSSDDANKPLEAPCAPSFDLQVASAGMLRPQLVSEPKTNDIMMRLLQWRTRPGLSEESRQTAQQLYEYVDKVQKQLIQDQKIAMDLEQHMSLLSQGFRDREERYRGDINQAQDKLLDLAKEKERLQSIFKRYAAELKLVREQQDHAFREREEDKERYASEEEACRNQLAQIMTEKRTLAARLQELEDRSSRIEADNQRLKDFGPTRRWKPCVTAEPASTAATRRAEA